jgi:hypothetical protein
MRNQPSWPVENQEKNFPMGPVYDDYESDPWESQEEEPEEQQKGNFGSCLEPISEHPSPERSQPPSSYHPPVLTRDIRPCVRSCGAEQSFCHKFFGVYHLFYGPMGGYM